MWRARVLIQLSLRVFLNVVCSVGTIQWRDFTKLSMSTPLCRANLDTKALKVHDAKVVTSNRKVHDYTSVHQELDQSSDSVPAYTSRTLSCLDEPTNVRMSTGRLLCRTKQECNALKTNDTVSVKNSNRKLVHRGGPPQEFASSSVDLGTTVPRKPIRRVPAGTLLQRSHTKGEPPKPYGATGTSTKKRNLHQCARCPQGLTPSSHVGGISSPQKQNAKIMTSTGLHHSDTERMHEAQKSQYATRVSTPKRKRCQHASTPQEFTLSPVYVPNVHLRKSSSCFVPRNGIRAEARYSFL